ncbi:hypothetical protein [Sphingomonas sp. Root710]|uniref:hypothetical protein n=1 Tax=Sphingomonas sp. Root710 TaxID=1736594 RepID=UPI001F1C7859|nr:hypothetical protein [Sphingomonas sp. Root710]
MKRVNRGRPGNGDFRHIHRMYGTFHRGVVLFQLFNAGPRFFWRDNNGLSAISFRSSKYWPLCLFDAFPFIAAKCFGAAELFSGLRAALQ